MRFFLVENSVPLMQGVEQCWLGWVEWSQTLCSWPHPVSPSCDHPDLPAIYTGLSWEWIAVLSTLQVPSASTGIPSSQGDHSKTFLSLSLLNLWVDENIKEMQGILPLSDGDEQRRLTKLIHWWDDHARDCQAVFIFKLKRPPLHLH